MGQPTVTPLVEAFHDGGFIVSVANGHQSFSQKTLTGVKGLAGMVAGLVLSGLTASSVAAAGNTGNGAMGAITVNTVATQVGVYQLVYTAATAFTVTAPDGDTATGTNGVAFSALGIGFTMTTGGTPMVAGDGFAITVLGATGKPTATSAANGGNTGNSTMGSVTTTGYAPKVGRYVLTVIEPGANVGTFQLEDPLGKVVGTGVVAAAASIDGLSFTLADGATDFVSGDRFDIIVTAGSGKAVQWNPSAVDGSGTVAGILVYATDASSVDKLCTLLDAHAEVNASEIVWPTGANAATIAAGIAQLRTLGIKAV